MSPEDVPAEWVEKALNTRLPSGGLPTLNEPQMRAILAAVLPEAMAEAWEQGHDAGFDTGNEYGQGHEFPVSTDNPYREGAKGDGEG